MWAFQELPGLSHHLWKLKNWTLLFPAAYLNIYILILYCNEKENLSNLVKEENYKGSWGIAELAIHILWSTQGGSGFPTLHISRHWDWDHISYRKGALAFSSCISPTGNTVIPMGYIAILGPFEVSRKEHIGEGGGWSPFSTHDIVDPNQALLAWELRIYNSCLDAYFRSNVCTS